MGKIKNEQPHVGRTLIRNIIVMLKLRHNVASQRIQRNLHAFLSSADFFHNQFFPKNSFGNIPSECQTVEPDRPNMLSGLIWVHTVCKGYQQTTKIPASGERVNLLSYRIDALPCPSFSWVSTVKSNTISWAG